MIVIARNIIKTDANIIRFKRKNLPNLLKLNPVFSVIDLIMSRMQYLKNEYIKISRQIYVMENKSRDMMVNDGSVKNVAICSRLAPINELKSWLNRYKLIRNSKSKTNVNRKGFLFSLISFKTLKNKEFLSFSIISFLFIIKKRCGLQDSYN